MNQPSVARASAIESKLNPPAGDIEHLPDHIAIIMDGNGRWARSHGKSRPEGHRAGTNNIRRLIETVHSHGVKYLTLFAFSTENWSRPDDEVSSLLQILGDVIASEVQELHEQGVRILHLGRLDRLPSGLQKAICDSVELTKHNEGLTVSVAFDYGGRFDILNAVRRMIADNVPPDRITEDTFSSYLYTSELPDPDLIIRTAGEMRISNFLLWQSAYSEYYSTSVLWPEFDEVEITKALAAYSKRQRRFGKVDSQDSV